MSPPLGMPARAVSIDSVEPPALIASEDISDFLALLYDGRPCSIITPEPTEFPPNGPSDPLHLWSSSDDLKILPLPGMNTEETFPKIRTRAVTRSASAGRDPERSQTILGDTWGWTNAVLKKAQLADTDIGPVYRWLMNNTAPSQEELEASSPATRAYYMGRELLRFHDQILFMFRPKDSGDKLLLPKQLRDEALHLLHSIPSAGHPGVIRTLERVKYRFTWFKVKADVYDFVAGCQACNLNKGPNRKARAPLRERPAADTLERFHIDYLGPLTRTSKGNRFVLVGADAFSRWVEAIPLPDQTARTTAEALLNIFLRIGLPKSVVSDRGTNFESQLMRELWEMLGVDRKRTTPYRPAANGLAERVNKVLMDAVRCCLMEKRNDWDEWVPQVAAAIRATVNRSTGYSPNFLMFGREVNVPVDLMYGPPTAKYDDENIDVYVKNMRSSMRSAFEIARTKTKEMQKANKSKYDLRILQRQYEVGDVVYLLHHSTDLSTSKKLKLIWKGPGVVVKKITSYLYTVRLRQKWLTVHHDQMKPCKLKRLPAWVNKAIDEGPLADESDDKSKICLCRQPEGNRDLLMCDWCEKRYHASCVNIAVQEHNANEPWQCPSCKGDPDTLRATAWFTKPKRKKKFLPIIAEDSEDEEESHEPRPGFSSDLT